MRNKNAFAGALRVTSRAKEFSNFRTFLLVSTKNVDLWANPNERLPLIGW